jgi:YopX protein
MEEYKPRKIKFKAWNKEVQLLVRLNSIDCHRGELVKKDHILLQFTGLHDKDGEEIYDRDVLLIDYEKFLIFWDDDKKGWYYYSLDKLKTPNTFNELIARSMKRFCSHFELTKKI